MSIVCSTYIVHSLGQLGNLKRIQCVCNQKIVERDLCRLYTVRGQVRDPLLRYQVKPFRQSKDVSSYVIQKMHVCYCMSRVPEFELVPEYACTEHDIHIYKRFCITWLEFVQASNSKFQVISNIILVAPCEITDCAQSRGYVNDREGRSLP